MRFLIGLFFMLFVAAFFITGGIWVLYKIFSGLGLPVGDKATDSLVRRLRAYLQSTRKTLVPWEMEMLPLLSLRQLEVKKPGFMGRPASGVFSTIYHEPVVVYAEQRMGKTKLVIAQMTDREFVFRKSERQTEIWVNSQPLGVLVSGTLLAPGSKSEVLAQIDRENEIGHQTLNISNKPIAALLQPGGNTGPNPRALTMLRDASPEEENVLLAMTILQMTKVS